MYPRAAPQVGIGRKGSLEMSGQDVVHKQCVYERCDCACVGENRLISVWGVTGMARGFDCRAELE